MRWAALRAWPCDLSAPSLLQRLRVRCFLVTLMLACALPMPSAQANLVVTDDSGHVLALPRVAERIVSLAPHTTELLFAAGAGSKIVGVSEFSDYPSEATKLPSVGSSMQLDIERIVALKPDLIIAWQSGNHARQVERLRKLGYPVFYSEPHRLDDIASTLEKLGTLAGSEQGPRAARAFRQRHQALGQRYAGKAPIRVFYQIWPSPLMTLNDRHIVSDVLKVCGAINVFGKLPQLAPTISREAVVDARPVAIFTSDERNDSWDRWRALRQLPAVQLGNLYRVDGAVMNRAGPRMLAAAEALCMQIDDARMKLALSDAERSASGAGQAPTSKKP